MVFFLCCVWCFVVDNYCVFLVRLIYMMFFLVLFFFSSRRRHTICLSDWSSDVCSSDLLLVGCVPAPSRAHGGGAERVRASALRGSRRRRPAARDRRALRSLRSRYRSGRSEERRVGRVGGCRW